MDTQNTASKFVVFEDDNNKITSSNSNNVYFSNDKVEEYIKLFNTLKEEGILEGEYQDNIWIGKHEHYRTKLRFGLEYLGNINNSLKSFILIRLMEGNKIKTVFQLIREITEVVVKTGCFQEEKYNEFEDWFWIQTERRRGVISIPNYSFLQFNQLYDNEYMDLFAANRNLEDIVRELPDYKSVLMFDYILHDYLETSTVKERILYFPLLLWWKITKVIPLRPSEFLKVKFDCIKEEDGNVYLILPREKQRETRNRLAVTDEVKITNDIADLIGEYKSYINEDDISDNLISYRTYFNMLDSYQKHNVVKQKLNLDVMEYSSMRNLMDMFYTNIVEKTYRVENIDRMRFGDTRHFAFCNMMLQGFNMLTIARIGGHRSLQSQIHYVGHLDYFAESRVKVLADRIKFNRINSSEEQVVFSDIDSLIVRSKLNTGKQGKLKVEHGYCLDKENFPLNCIKECIYCPFFQLDLTSPKSKEYLQKQSNIMSKHINQQLKAMLKTTQSMFYDVNDMKYLPEEQEYLSSLSGKLKELINKKAYIDSYKVEREKEEKNDE